MSLMNYRIPYFSELYGSYAISLCLFCFSIIRLFSFRNSKSKGGMVWIGCGSFLFISCFCSLKELLIEINFYFH